MKYLLYFHFYAISCGDTLCHPIITTILLVQNDSVMFYIYDLGYVKWKIDEIEREKVDFTSMRYGRRYKYKRPRVDAIYHISYKDIKGFAIITHISSEIRVLIEGKRPEIIQLKE